MSIYTWRIVICWTRGHAWPPWSVDATLEYCARCGQERTAVGA